MPTIRRRHLIQGMPLSLALTHACAQSPQSSLVSDGLAVFAPVETLGAFKTSLAAGQDVRYSSDIELVAPSVALAGQLVVRVKYAGEAPQAIALFARPVDRSVVGNKFDGAEAPLFVVKLSPRMVSEWSVPMRFERSTRLLALVVTSIGTLAAAETEIKLGRATRPASH